jgi:hypothetical protein
VSANWSADDLARLVALAHAFGILALISAGNFAQLANVKPSEAVKQFRRAIKGSVHDGDLASDVQVLMRKHLKRIFDNVSDMAKHADHGFPGLEHVPASMNGK